MLRLLNDLFGRRVISSFEVGDSFIVRWKFLTVKITGYEEEKYKVTIVPFPIGFYPISAPLVEETELTHEEILRLLNN